MVRAKSDDSTAEMFEELDTSKPEHKSLLAAAKKFAKEKAARSALLTTSKEKVDALGEKLIAQMHECKLTCFRHEGVRVEIIQSSEKPEVKLESGDEDETDDE